MKTYQLDGFSIVVRKENECWNVELSKHGFSTLLKRFTKEKYALRFVTLVLSF